MCSAMARRSERLGYASLLVALIQGACSVQEWDLAGEFSCIEDAHCATGYVCKAGGCWRPGDAVCGDGVVEGDEVCDDGNVVEETKCDYGSGSCLACNAACTASLSLKGSICGDGTIDADGGGGEQCDDGGAHDGDGCSRACKVEGGAGWSCDAASPTVCQRCGNEQVEGSEACDDGADNGAYGHCRADCSGAGRRCGDATVDGGDGEQCDDGNLDAGDGCSGTCRIESASGWTCGGASPSVCQRCGNGAVEGTEQCDDGLHNGRYGYCGATCTGPGPRCGDGEVQSVFGESCDMGDSQGSPCTPNCNIRAIIVAQFSHTCVLHGNAGGVACWGALASSGGSVDAFQPVEVGGFSDPVVDLSAGGNHDCAVLAPGAAVCWGSNDRGQLGIGGAASGDLEPVSVSGLSRGVLGVAAGAYHSCALLEGGGVMCWGNNEHGQLGHGQHGTNEAHPVVVEGLQSAAVDLTTGFHHSCALLETGAIACWGAGGYGQLGGQHGALVQATAAEVQDLGGQAVRVAAGSSHTCAVLTSGVVRCWGAGAYGRLGNGAMVGSSAPVSVVGIEEAAVDVVGGHYHTCALLHSGAVRCWGRDNHGQLGDGGANRDTGTSVAVDGLHGRAVAIAAGAFHTCALLDSGAAQCWGQNTRGQLGTDAVTQSSSTPVAVAPW